MKKQWIVLTLAVVSALLYVGCKKTQPQPQPQAETSTPAESTKEVQPAAPAQPTEVIKLTYANFPPAPTFPCVQMERWKTEVEKRTNNKVTVQTFPGGSLLDAKEMMDGVINGQADIGCLCMAYQPGRFIVTNAAALPLGIPSAKVGSQVLFDLYTKYKPEEFAKVKVLTMFTTAPANIMSKKPVRTLDDLKGMNLRASGEAAQILKAWGANQVGMPMSATPEALQKGVVDGLFSSVEVMKDFKYAELCKYITMTETNIYPFAVVMNQKKWDALPEDIKKVFDEMAVEQCVWTGEYMDNHVKESVEWSKTDQKVEVITLSSEELAKWNALLESNTQAWLKQANDAKLQGDQILADVKALIAKYSTPAK
ncbi:MAG: TRAP transporter substrate-binding protein DctP [Anaerohalosphaeraceae bacterium]